MVLIICDSVRFGSQSAEQQDDREGVGVPHRDPLFLQFRRQDGLPAGLEQGRHFRARLRIGRVVREIDGFPRVLFQVVERGGHGALLQFHEAVAPVADDLFVGALHQEHGALPRLRWIHEQRREAGAFEIGRHLEAKQRADRGHEIHELDELAADLAIGRRAGHAHPQRARGAWTRASSTWTRTRGRRGGSRDPP